MKILRTFLALALLILPAACQTARDTTADATDIAGHAVAKTGHAIQHGGEKLAGAN